MMTDPIPGHAVCCRVASVWTSGPLISVRYLPGVEVALDDAKEMIALGAKIGNGRAQPIFVDLRALRAMSPEARVYLASNEVAATTSAVALFIASPLSRMIGNFFLAIYAGDIPTRLFTEPEPAKAWLLDLVEAVPA